MFIKQGKWDWPIAKKIKTFYGANGLIKTILYVLLIVLGLKLVVLNGIIFVLNLFGAGFEYAPILKSLGII